MIEVGAKKGPVKIIDYLQGGKMKNSSKTIISAISMLMLTIPVSASAVTIIGSVNEVNGDVLIERNGESLLAQEQSLLLPGDQIITTEGSNVTIRMDEGCENMISESSTISVGLSDFCSNIVKVAQVTPDTVAPPASAPASTPPITTLAVAPTQFPAALAIGLGVTFAGGIVLITEDGSPVSP